MMRIQIWLDSDGGKPQPGCMMRYILILTFSLTGALRAENPSILLWPEGKVPQPHPKATEPERVDRSAPGPEGFALRRNVTAPRLVVYSPAEGKANGAAVVIVPGGGFGILADEHEGSEAGEWLAKQGVTAFLLQHRCPTNKHPEPNMAPAQDTQRAMSLVRGRAAEWKLDQKRIGLLGFSAGGQVAAVAATNPQLYGPISEPENAANVSPDHRPDFLLLIYPWRIYDEQTKALRADIRITGDMPPVFIAQAADDPSSLPQGSTLLYLALLQSRPAQSPPAHELHIYARGGHGFGLRPAEGAPGRTDWTLRAADWLKVAGVCK